MQSKSHAVLSDALSDLSSSVLADPDLRVETPDARRRSHVEDLVESDASQGLRRNGASHSTPRVRDDLSSMISELILPERKVF